ncbi:trypsin-like peptidase domain-containing protein [Paracnuella aquatica]|uniref:trypsin-like peptidase domain-containing protein n=1 Tax=Paracnuella aquatica TaxID=2268757 RepID=UPI000DEF5EC7|nr:trypsin-like peptidase domain-containing protein [Paracnuella aquatica]RPD43414.1 tetratricopeptide repeat protein [Paracnuella aquatica]
MTKIFLLLALTASTFIYGQKNLKALVKENEKSVFLVQCFDEKSQMISTGSGFFIENTGVAFTNVHVIRDAFKARIKTIEGKFYEVEKIIDYNPNLDIAKIKIKAVPGTSFPAVKIAARNAEKGDDVFAIGNPDGLESTVSSGIISSVRSITNYGECYQITAPISPGSSGGALFNMNGEVIGMTTFGQIDQSRLNQNLNFAVNIKNSKYLTNNLNISTEKAYKEIVYEDFIAAYMRADLSGDFERAVEICNLQIKKSPSNWLPYHFRASSFLRSDNYTEAEKDLIKAIQLNPSNRLKDMDYVGLGKIYRRSRMFEKSRDAYLKAIEINNKNATCFCNMSALAYEWLGPENELVEYSYSEALKIDPLSCAFGLKKIGEKLMNKKEYEKAIQFFTLAIESETEGLLSLNEYYNRGFCYLELKQYKSAISDFQSCLRLNKTDVGAYIALGITYSEMGDKMQSCISFNKAKEINDLVVKDRAAAEQISGWLSQCK